MENELVEVRPSELKFVFELKKQSSCSVQITNKSIHHVAFKVKTTAPKKYCVKPNVGIVSPKTTFDFTVTMQAPKVALSELQCKDKFLVQSAVVPAGTTEEDLSDLFSKGSVHYVEESKLRVVLVSPAHSPVLRPINGFLAEEPPAPLTLLDGVEDKPVEKILPFTLTDTPSKATGAENVALKVAHLESKLKEAEKTIERLSEEQESASREKSRLQQEVMLLRRRAAAKGQVGFPFLFVCFVALVALTVGYLVHSV